MCRVLGFSERVWDENKANILERGLTAKFSQNQDLLERLLNTRDKILVEVGFLVMSQMFAYTISFQASPVDRIYGVGLEATDPLIRDPKNWRGQSNDFLFNCVG